MGYRFSRRIKIAPGLKLNLSASGVSVTGGVKGASITIGRKGTSANISLIGTGISYRTRLDKKSLSPSGKKDDYHNINFAISQDGSLKITDENGLGLPVNVASKIKKTHKASIEIFLHQHCERLNRQLKSILEVHLLTQPPQCILEYHPKDFLDPSPLRPLIKKYGFLGLLFKNRRRKIDFINDSNQHTYEVTFQAWNLTKANHELKEKNIQSLYISERFQSADGMMKCLDHRLSEVEWPMETEMTYEISSDLKAIWMDVDLPEIEDMPSEMAIFTPKSLNVSLKKISDTEIRKSYMVHTHGVLFRLIGEIFSCLPMIEKVVISGYSQRSSRLTADIMDEYLLSLEMDRMVWGKYEFQNLASLDVVSAFDDGNLKRSMTKTGIFKPIIPFEKP